MNCTTATKPLGNYKPPVSVFDDLCYFARRDAELQDYMDEFSERDFTTQTVTLSELHGTYFIEIEIPGMHRRYFHFSRDSD